jgi:acyl-CoA reductase-like NAD-dependent aldehyde dehydrogenase
MEPAMVERTSAGGVTVNHTVLHVGVGDLPFGGPGPALPRRPSGNTMLVSVQRERNPARLAARAAVHQSTSS